MLLFFFTKTSPLEHNLPRQPSAFPLLARGWVYQERLLCPRVVHFIQTEIRWECRALKRCECRASDHVYESDEENLRFLGADYQHGTTLSTTIVEWL
jgi:hypothetical protein